MRMLVQNMYRGIKTPTHQLPHFNNKKNQEEDLNFISKILSSAKSSTILMMLSFVMFSAPSLFGQDPCTGNVAIENLANGMDYTIVSGADGTVDVTLTVVDNPAGLVGFFGGAGNPISFPDANGTFTFNFTGETVGDAFIVDMFFNWAAGGAGNSQTITITVGSCGPAATCTGNVAIENLANGMDYTIVSDGSGNVDVTLTVVDNPAGLVGFFGGAGNPISFPDANGTFTYNFTGETPGAAFVVDMFFNWAAGGAGNSETVTVTVGGACSAPVVTCSGNVAIENLTNGMDYTIVSDESGNVDVSLTVVDNPAGLVGFYGGAGNPISFPDANGTFTYNFTGEMPGDAFVVDMFLNWAAGGAGNSETITVTVNGPCFGSAPTTNAPEPTCDAMNVVSVYGDFYPTNIATNYDPNWGQTGHTLVDPAYDPGTGNPILAYPNFNYQGTELVTTDLSGMEYLNFDIWTAADPASTFLQVTPVQPGPIEYLVDVPYVQGEWTSITLPMSDFLGMTWTDVFQMKFAANGPGSTNPVDIYLDNIYFSSCSLTAPVTNAPEPTCPAGDVVSVYGDFYPTNIATNYDPNWGQTGHMLVDPAYDPGTGNPILAYPNFNYQGTELTTTDLSGMDFLHFDIWTAADPTSTFIQVTPVQPGPLEFLVDVPYVSGEWTNVILPMSEFVGMSWADVFQMKFAANGAGSTNPVDIYLDNIYFSTCAPTAPTTNAAEPKCDPADVVSIYGDFYPSPIATNYDPNWGQTGHTLVDPNYDPGTGNPVLAYPNFNYQGTELITTDLSGMEYLIFDVWTAADPASSFLQVTPVQPGPVEFLVDVPYVSGEWTNIVLPMSDFVGMTWADVFQMKFAVNGAGSVNPIDIYLDNVYFSTCNPNESPYCSDFVTHFGGDPASSAILSILNTGPTSMEVQIESANSDPIDLLLVNGGSGATVSPGVETAPGVFTSTLTWTTSPPSDVLLNVLWSKASFGGNWQLSAADVSIPFIAVCPASAPCTQVAADCTACDTCEDTFSVDLTSGTILNVAQEFGPGFCCFQENAAPDYDSGTNIGTLMLSEGSVNAFAVAGVENLALPDYIEDICLTADIDVLTGSYPFVLEFRLENGTGAPGNNGQAVTFDVMVDGDGMCSVGGGLADAVLVNGFEFVPGGNYGVVIGLADFSGNPVDENIVVRVSNISLSVCAADSEAPILDCPNADELVANGGFDNVITPSAFPQPADFDAWEEIGDVFEDANTIDPSMKLFGATAGVFQDFPVAEGDWICGYAEILSQSIDFIAAADSWAEVKVEFYDANGTIINGPFGTVLGDYNLNSPATPNIWTKTGGCIQTPENAVTGRAVVIFLNFSGAGGSVLVDNASFTKINPIYVEANADGCTANTDFMNPTPVDDCEVVSFTNTFNGTEDANGNYPQGFTFVTYTAVDANGNESCCSILVEVGDMTGPVIDCPNDITVQLEPGECEEVVLFTVPFSDICGPIDAEASQAINETLVNNGVDCQNNTSNHLRYFENSQVVPVEITQVNFGINNSGTM
ncbi:MAG: hypothetical protein P1U56_25765, partial [Saprospiraceae bacterium]|nr:hypothetical protein [Saprospiraceae bacterium]